MTVPVSKHKTRFISGVSEIADDYDAFMIDVWGVVHDGVRLNPGSQSCLDQMLSQNKSIVFLSNTPFRSYELGKSLRDMGLTFPENDVTIMTAGESSWMDIQNWLGRKVFLMGQPYEGLLEGMTLTSDVTQAHCMLTTVGGSYAGEDSIFYEAMELALPLGIPLICANPDLEVQIGENLALCAGTYAQWYQDRGGDVHWHGKPYQPVYAQAWKLLGKPDKSKICAIGDSLRKDMSGAKNFGIDGLWNLDGINRDLNETQAQSLLDEKGLCPAAMMKGFSW